MPLYEYECTQCHRRTEKIQKFSDPEITVCPHCGGVLARTITAPAIQFKGAGWYKDLYSSPKPPTASGDNASKPAGGEGAGPASGGDKSPAAPATTAAAAPAAPSSSGSTGS